MREKSRSRPDNIREYAADLATRLVEVLYDNFNKLGAEGNIEFLHDMRVASRRLREVFVFFSFLQDEAKLRKTISRIREITRTVGKSREMDVNIELLNQLVLAPDPGVEATCEHLLELFALERERIQRRMDKGLKAMKLKERRAGFLKVARAFLVVPASPAQTYDGSVAMSLNTFSQKAESAIRSRLSGVEEFKGIEASPGNDSTLHQLRIRVKKLRYTLEICDPLFESRFQRALGLAKELQDWLGKIHDYGVLIDRLVHQHASLERNKRKYLLEGSGVIVRMLQDSKREFYAHFRPAYEAFVGEISCCVSTENSLQPLQSTQVAVQPDIPNPFMDF